MANVYDYVAKYGKYTFEQKAFNEVDNLVFSLLAYLDFTDTRINENNRTLEEVGREYLGKHSYKEIMSNGAVKKHPQKTDRHITESIDGYVPVVV